MFNNISFHISVRGRLVIVLVSLAVLPVLLVGGLAYRNARMTIEARVISQLTSIADLKKEQITTWIEGRSADARLIAQDEPEAVSVSMIASRLRQ